MQESRDRPDSDRCAPAGAGYHQAMTTNAPTLPGMTPEPPKPGPVSLAIAGMVEAGEAAWTANALESAMVTTAAANVDRAEAEGSSWAVANAIRALVALLESLTPPAPPDAPPADSDAAGIEAFMESLRVDAGP